MSTSPASDILLVESNPPGAVISVDSETGVQKVISSGGMLVDPHGIVVSQEGEILVSDPGASAILGIDPITGLQREVTGGGELVEPLGLAVADDGTLLVADRASQGSGAVVGVDPVSGRQWVISTGMHLEGPRDLVVLESGDLMVADVTPTGFPPFPGPGRIVRVEPVTGNQTVITTSFDWRTPCGIALEEDGSLLVVDASVFGTPLGGPGGILRVDLATGAVETVLAGQDAPLHLGCGIAPVPGRKSLWATASALLFRVEELTGLPVEVSAGNYLGRPRMIIMHSRAAPAIPPVAIPASTPAGLAWMATALALTGGLLLPKRLPNDSVFTALPRGEAMLLGATTSQCTRWARRSRCRQKPT